MITLTEEKLLYSEIQKKLFYIIPEKWESIYLYASVIDVRRRRCRIGIYVKGRGFVKNIELTYSKFGSFKVCS